MSKSIVPHSPRVRRVQPYEPIEPQSPTPLESGLLGFGLGGISTVLLLAPSIRRQIDQLHATIAGWQAYANRLLKENSDLRGELWSIRMELMAVRANADRLDNENARLRQRNEYLAAERTASQSTAST